ncbi:MAG TPA: AraC family transcriptional regulator [Thermoanaerobaculia bacterium]|nr:AraC family transcriptional regulator [Thermoanaerobaculia bacterium]
MHGAHSFGTEVQSCEVNGIRVAETLMPAGLSLDEHSHEWGQICFVLEGSYRERTADGDRELRAGHVQFRAPGERHANCFQSGDALTLLVSIEQARWLDVVGRRPFQPSPMLRDLADEVRHELTDGDWASGAALEGLSLLLLSRVSREAGLSAPEPQWLSDAVSFIERRYADEVSLSAVAAAVGVHRATLAAAFRRFRSTSVGEYIRNLRLRHAARALLHTSMPLGEIAVTCGFADQAHFGRLFRKMRGMTPGAFRRRSLRSG